MKKGRITYEVVGLILIVFLIIVLLDVFGIFQRIIIAIFGDVTCQASFVASSMTEKFSILGKNIEPECKTNRITVVENPTEERETETGGTIYPLNTEYTSTLPHGGSTYDFVYEWNLDKPEEFAYPYINDEKKDENGEEYSQMEKQERVTMRYNMDRLLANELERCWTVTNKGNLPIFDKYWDYIGCEQGGGTVTNCDIKNFWDYFENIPKYKTRDSANFCVLCARIKFEPKVQNAFTDNYDSLDRWMGNHPYRLDSKVSYYEYILDEPQKETQFALPHYEYSTEKPLAVVFIRASFHAFPSTLYWFSNLGDTAIGVVFPRYETPQEKPVYYGNILKIIPYEDLPNTCHFLVATDV